MEEKERGWEEGRDRVGDARKSKRGREPSIECAKQHPNLKGSHHAEVPYSPPGRNSHFLFSIFKLGVGSGDGSVCLWL